MFRSFRYLDTDRLEAYQGILEGNNPSIASKRKQISAKAKLGMIEVGTSSEVDSVISPAENYFSTYDSFENKLHNLSGDQFFDFTTNECWDITTLPGMSLIKLRAYIETPESFDSFSAFQQFLPMLNSMGMIDNGDGGASTEIALKLFSDASADIPILISDLDINIASKLKAKYIIGKDYQDLEELAEDEAFILCKVVSYSRKESVPIFDPLKDFIRINRTFRRGIERNEQLQVLYAKGPVLKVEVIAVYN